MKKFPARSPPRITTLLGIALEGIMDWNAIQDDIINRGLCGVSLTSCMSELEVGLAI